jgi:hypothetical protein
MTVGPMAQLRGGLGPHRIEVYAPAAYFAAGFDGSTAPVDLMMAAAGALAHREAADDDNDIAAWHRLAAVADRIVPVDAPALAFARARWPTLQAKMTAPATATRPTPARVAAIAAQPRLGVALLAETSRCRALIRVLAQRLSLTGTTAPAVVVLGETADDLGLIRAGGMLITGGWQAGELAGLADRYAVTHLLLLSSSAQFGVPAALEASRLGRPCAAFKWGPSAGDAAADLALDPALSDAAVATCVAAWLTTPPPVPEEPHP